MKDFKTITTSSKPCKSFPSKTIESASFGIELNEFRKKNKSKTALCAAINKIKEENGDPIPFVHEDSLTAWANQGIEKFGLTVGDIMGMKFGETMEVILMDRNSGGECMPEKIKIGSKFMPTKIGFSYATYIHGENLSGILKFDFTEEVHAPFTWEINRAAVGDKNFWGPFNYCERGCGKESKLQVSDLDPKILVGWRGPSIRMSDAKKYLPQYAVKYDTWWDDGVIHKYKDYLHKK